MTIIICLIDIAFDFFVGIFWLMKLMKKDKQTNHIKKSKQKGWTNNIRLTYDIRLMPNSNKTLLQAADDMITGVTIGTIQTSVGTYTPKVHCLFGPHPGLYKGEVISVNEKSEAEGEVTVAFSSEIAQVEEIGFAGLFSVAAGDGLGTAYEMEKVRLKNIELPDEVLKFFPGPRYGSEGIRQILNIKEINKPLVALLLKPNTGQPSEHYARFAKEAALAGVDYIKEDELQFNHPLCPLSDRVEKITRALNIAEQTTGKKVMYAPNITCGSQDKMIENAKKVVELGATAVMINVMQVGLDSLRLLRDADIGVPIHIHRAGHDNYSRGDVGVDLNALSLMFRLAGADLIHTGPVFGNLYDPNSIIMNVKALCSSLPGIKKSLPILSRSASTILQDSIDYLSTEKDIANPSNVMFLVDKDVYENADKKTGSILSAVEYFVSKTNSLSLGGERTKEEILKNQGYLSS